MMVQTLENVNATVDYLCGISELRRLAAKRDVGRNRLLVCWMHLLRFYPIANDDIPETPPKPPPGPDNFIQKGFPWNPIATIRQWNRDYQKGKRAEFNRQRDRRYRAMVKEQKANGND